MDDVRWLVTGTDTGVGKTLVSAALCRTLLDAFDGPVTYVKPAQSGVDDGDDDAATVRSLVPDARLRLVVGVRLGAALAPSVAARREGVTVTGSELAGVVPRGGPVVVEGAGGLLVELGTDGSSAADLARACGLSAVVVARPGLGTLNHTLLTVEACRARGLDVRGVVVSGVAVPPVDGAEASNPGELHRLTGGLLAGLVPRLPVPASPFPAGTTRTWFAPSLAGRLDVDGALRALATATSVPRVAPPAEPRRGWWRR